MKNLAVVVAAIILISCCVTSHVTARDLESFQPLGNEKLEWWHYHYFPYYHPKPYWHWPAGGKALPPLPAGYKPFHPVPFHPPPEVTKCLSDCKDVRTCFQSVAMAFFSGKPVIGSECCASIQKMDGDCEKTVFGSFHNPFFNCFVKLHCSTNAASTPSAPSPA